MKYTATLVKENIDKRLAARRAEALARGIPVADEETLNFLLLTLEMYKPERILEIGTAVGLSGVAMLQTLPNANLTTIELEEERYEEMDEVPKKTADPDAARMKAKFVVEKAEDEAEKQEMNE